MLGTSGGAIVALNAALKEPNLFYKIIADSFMGESLFNDFAEKIVDYRKIAKQKLGSKIFWFMMHGFDWEKIIDQNTKLMVDSSKIMDYARSVMPVIRSGLSYEDYAELGIVKGKINIYGEKNLNKF